MGKNQFHVSYCARCAALRKLRPCDGLTRFVQKNDAKALENLDSVLICKSSRYAFAVSTIAYNFSHIFRLFYFVKSQFLSVERNGFCGLGRCL